MTGAWRTISVALTANSAGYSRAMGAASASTAKFDAQNKKTTAAAGSRWQSFGKAAATVFVVLSLAIAGSIDQAIKWESAWAGVTKTVDGTAAQMSELEGDLLSMARVLPASREEIAGVAEAAGQLGIERENIAQFTEVMIAMGSSTNLAAEDAATGIARFMNVMGTAPGDVERLGATIVDLGNKGASTESEIMEMAQRIAGAGALVGASEADVLALSNALSSMGIEAQLGGGAIQRVFLKIYDAAMEGGDAVAVFADTAGMGAEEFQQSWKDAPMQTFDKVIKGLEGIKDGGGNVITTLSDMGIKGTQERSVLLRMLGASDLLTQSLKDGTTAWDEGSALAEEAAKRYATAESQLKIFGNKVSDVARIVGAEFIPMLLDALAGAEKFGAWIQQVGISAADRLQGAWGNLQSAGQDLASVLEEMWEFAEPTVKAMAALGGAAVLGAISGLAAGLAGVAGFLADNEWAVKGLVTALVGLGGVVTFGIIIGLIETMYLKWLFFTAAVKGTALFQGLSAITGGFMTMASGSMHGIGQVRAGLGTLASSAAVTAGAIGVAAYAVIEMFNDVEGAENKAKAAVEALKPKGFDPSNIESMRQYADALARSTDTARDTNDAHGGMFETIWQGAKVAIPGMESSALDAAKALTEMENAAADNDQAVVVLGATLDELARRTGLSTEAVQIWLGALDLDPLGASQRDIAAAIGEAANAAEHGTVQTDSLTDAYAGLAEETASATDQLKAWKELVDAVMGVEMGVFDATTKWRGSLSSLSDAMKTGGWGQLDATTEAGRKNREALSGAAQAAIDYAEAIGRTEAGIPGANMALAASRSEMVKVLEQTGLTRKAAEEYLDTLGMTPDNIETIITANTDTAAERLTAIQTKLAETPDSKNIHVTATGINAITVQLDALARDRQAKVNVVMGEIQNRTGQSTGQIFGQRWGGIDNMATGGIRQAMLGSGSNMVWWDEPETGGEAYIPRRGHPGRNRSILEVAAGWQGLALVDPTKTHKMATGGVMHAIPPQPHLVNAGGNTSTRNYHGGITSTINMPQAKVSERDIERVLRRAFAP